MNTRKCDQCKEEFTPRVDWQRFCKDQCHDDYWRELRQLAKKLKDLK